MGKIVEGLIFIIWFAVSLAFMLQRLPESSYRVAENIRRQLCDCPYTHYPLQHFSDIQNWDDVRSFMRICFLPFVFNKATWIEPSLVNHTAWNWPGVQLEDPTIQLTGPIQIWQVRPDVGRLGPFMGLSQHNKTIATYIPHQYLIDGESVGKQNDYPFSGYYYQWYQNTTVQDAYQDFDILYGHMIRYETWKMNPGLLTSQWLVEGQSQATYFSLMLINDGLPVVISFVIEQPSTGGLVASYKIEDLIEVNLAMFIAVYIFFLLFLHNQIKKIWEQRQRYFTNLWNCIETAQCVMHIVSFFFCVSFISYYYDSLNQSSEDAAAFAVGMKAIHMHGKFIQFFGSAVCLMWLQLLKYLDIIPGLGLPINALNMAGIEVVAFMMAIVALVFGMALAFHMWFLVELSSFGTLTSSLLQMLEALDGYPNFQQFQGHRSYGGMLTLLSFEYIMFFFVLAMLIAIVTAAYDKVHQDFVEEGKEFWTLDRLVKYMRKVYTQQDATVQQQYEGSWKSFLAEKFNEYWASEEPGQAEDGKEETIKIEAEPKPLGFGEDEETFSKYEQERAQLEAGALLALEEIVGAARDVHQCASDIGEHVNQVDTLQARIDAGCMTQDAVDKTVLTLTTEVLARLR